MPPFYLYFLPAITRPTATATVAEAEAEIGAEVGAGAGGGAEVRLLSKNRARQTDGSV